jgi:hypothetical protein
VIQAIKGRREPRVTRVIKDKKVRLEQKVMKVE